MSMGSESGRLLTREELLEYLKDRLRSLEEEIRIVKSMIALLEGVKPREQEEQEPILYGKKKIAILYKASSYIRLVPQFDMKVPEEAMEYLEETVSQIREKQAKAGVPEEERAALHVDEAPDGGIVEIRIANIKSTVEHLKAKAALKYIAELAYELRRARGAQ